MFYGTPGWSPTTTRKVLPLNLGITKTTQALHHRSFIRFIVSGFLLLSIYLSHRKYQTLWLQNIKISSQDNLDDRLWSLDHQSKPSSSEIWESFGRSSQTSKSAIKSPYRPRPTSSQRRLSLSCTESWISKGEKCTDLKPAPIDLIWTWVNSSASSSTPTTDGYNLRHHEEEEGEKYLFREHDELRYSLRSTLDSLPAQEVRSRQVISAVDPVTGLGSLPSWFDRKKTSSSDGLSFVHHSDLFKIHRDQLIKRYNWLKSVLPSHNSLAIESQISNLVNLGDNLIYLNDDCFLLNRFSLGDFATEFWGPVFRIQWDLFVDDDSLEGRNSPGDLGEWTSLKYTNWLLSQRFGKRTRRYLSHTSKVLGVESLREVSNIWYSEIDETATSNFRGQKKEINTPFLTTWYHIEKHREALLHSFIILRSDVDSDGILSLSEWNQMLNEIGIEQTSANNSSELIKIDRPYRPIQSEKIYAGQGAPKQTNYFWFSSDGFPLFGNGGKLPSNYSSFEDGTKEQFCTINIKECFSTGPGSSSESVLKKIAFEKPQCGDCVIASLVGKSGTSGGMEAFLPPSTFQTTISRWRSEPEVTSYANFEKTSKDVRFISPSSWTSRIQRMIYRDKRTWAIRNIQRYQYVLGSSNIVFDAITFPKASKEVLSKIKSFKSNETIYETNSEETQSSSTRKPKMDGWMITINDRIPSGGNPIVESLFSNWLKTLWPIKSNWEL
ncbi:hypothetical protein BY996DRAFT_4582785 [Phakopsora pachyrhizi]|uniref:EF-hand domain-containing protein n=1 Tax=Phakopsora pachyrhizi TaxID=170000 RepID=A0AAV0AP17_PHAPC|nr:hypothetical protein BY996DRAFT_4582785 [Phakopsora pachyrhizi]CAH7669509.1 hypothetical protein PPACK8108_LOCUS4132 [Phakopsora pachyrhizi]